MKFLEKAFFSTKAMAVMLFLYAMAMAVATFVENDYGTPAAKELIYYSHWFNVLQGLLIINFAVNIKRYQLWRKEKWSLLLFHVAFIVMFIGAAYTHLFSLEGMMNIREGKTSNTIVSSQTYVKMSLYDGTDLLVYESPYTMTHFDSKSAPFPLRRQFKQRYNFQGKEIKLKALDYIPLAKDTVIEGKGKLTMEIVTVGQGGRKINYLQEGEIKEIAGGMFSFNNPIEGTIQLTTTPQGIKITSPLEGNSLTMEGQRIGKVTDSVALANSVQKVEVNTPQLLRLKAMYQIGPVNFVVAKQPYKAQLVFKPGDKNNPMEQANSSVVLMQYDDGKSKDTLVLRGGQGDVSYSVRKEINGRLVAMGFGSKNIEPPFSIKLRDFQIENYPGSKRPSSFASEVSVIDKGYEKNYRIYMNNVLDYGGYRFFQSGYDPDEHGTRLSVNQDRPGTIITYIGYGMLFLGMFLTLFWRGTRFHTLFRILKNLDKKKTLPLILFSIGLNLNAQTAEVDSVPLEHNHSEHNHEDIAHNHTHTNVSPFQEELQNMVTLESGEKIVSKIKFSPEHIQQLEHMLVQDNEGRIKPLGTHALELLRKIYKNDKFYGLAPVAWFISIQQDPTLWAKAPVIRVNKKIGSETLKKLKVDNTGHTSLLNLVDLKTGEFLLAKQYAESFRKKPSEKTEFDKEVINVTERFTIMDNIAKGYYLKMIPIKKDPNETWTSWIKEGEQLYIDTTALGFFNKYFNALGQAQVNGNWQRPNKVMDSISSYQQKWGKNVVPSPTKVSIEVFYNHFNPFLWVMIAYAILGTLLLTLAFTQLFTDRRYIAQLVNITLVATALVFAVHAIGLGLRWYISGHAPWTNGYEAVIFISWVGVLAGGLLYKNRNAFLPAAGCFVAVCMMGFAHGSALLDPQITPLVPVLKSYWLIIHVAIIAASYGFFGLGMILSFFSLTLYLFNPNARIEKNIKELTLVNEIALTIGIFALTVGTFLGGMWANESWGRYWSWDPKETWAYITIIIYAVVLHMRLVPGLRGNFAFSIASLWAVASPIMTYFGVNYYLSGLHTYAAGDKIPIPTWVPVTVFLFLVLSVFAYMKQKLWKSYFAEKGKGA